VLVPCNMPFQIQQSRFEISLHDFAKILCLLLANLTKFLLLNLSIFCHLSPPRQWMNSPSLRLHQVPESLAHLAQFHLGRLSLFSKAFCTPRKNLCNSPMTLIGLKTFTIPSFSMIFSCPPRNFSPFLLSL
jgi:hypothetical protein